MNWLAGNTVIGPALQVNFHFLGKPIYVNNGFYPSPVLLTSASLEFYATPPPLDQLNPNGQRNPMSVVPLSPPQNALLPGDWASMAGPDTLPAGAQYVLIIVVCRNADRQLGATDFVLLPLDAALAPSLTSVGISGNNVMIHFGSLLGRTYQLQSTSAITDGTIPWANVGNPVMATGADTMFTMPAGGAQNFYRLVLMP
jgi:hypothetical protein